jgi:uracil-DNA glycosylase
MEIQATTKRSDLPQVDRLKQFRDLLSEAASCRLCPAMCDRAAVLSELNGPIDARVMFIGEAPGRKGSDRTRTPFSGDQSGRNFEFFLQSINLGRQEIFITSAALCNPRKESGANRRPRVSELRNCSAFLRRTIDVIDPNIIATLGTAALDALKLLDHHDFNLRKDVGKIREWSGRLLVPLYHPSPQVLISSRDQHAQLRDYRAVWQAVQAAGRLGFPKKQRNDS